MATTLLVPASVGDVLDRISILAHKRERVAASAVANVASELAALLAAWPQALPAPNDIPEHAELDSVNRALWEVEDRLRAAEAMHQFGESFVADARSVYRLNDRRAALKRSVNLRYNSGLVEEKLHPRY